MNIPYESRGVLLRIDIAVRVPNVVGCRIAVGIEGCINEVQIVSALGDVTIKCVHTLRDTAATADAFLGLKGISAY
jgi:hypothetical protein